MPVRAQLRQLMEARAFLTRGEARQLMEMVLAGEAHGFEIAAIAGALAARGESAQEVAGFVDAMRAAAVPLPLAEAERALLVDTCGTGGDNAGTFNISTAAALVAAAAGAKVAKHGNRAVTSASGSADLLEELGIPVSMSAGQAAEALLRYGFAYLHAPALHPAMKAVMPIRHVLGVRTIFNLLGPLTNPAGAQAQVMGVFAADRVATVADAMVLLGTRHAFVVHGATTAGSSGPGMDEFSISGRSTVAEVRDGRIRNFTIQPEDVGLRRAPVESLRSADARESATIVRSILAGKPGACRDVVVFNTAAVLVTAAVSEDFGAGVKLAERTIDSGKACLLLNRLAGTSLSSTA